MLRSPARFLAGIMSVRGPSRKFFYDHEHDLFLYYLTLEAAVWNEEKDDFEYIFTRGGQRIKMEGGWKAVAEKMTRTFGREFTPESVSARYEKFSSDDGYLAKLFEEVMDFRDNMERVEAVMSA
jgi:hypothetical protein